MVPKQIMLIAGEPSGDLLAAELVPELRVALAQVQSRPTPDVQPLEASLAPQLFGAGGQHMAAAGVELVFDLTAHAVVGLIEVLTKLVKFKRLFNQLLRLAIERRPDAIICVDYSGFNRRFARAVKKYVRAHTGPFHNWNPKIIQYVSPQVWASRAGRAKAMARDFDLLLSIFPFEKQWYAEHVPGLRVEFVGHPMIDRYARAKAGMQNKEANVSTSGTTASYVPPPSSPLILLLPGSRVGELKRHLPVMIEAARRLEFERFVALRSKNRGPARLRMILPNESLRERARTFAAPLPNLQIRCGGLAESLAHAELAIASTGTVTLECACFGVPTVAIYKTSWSTFQIGKRIIKVKYLAMPNLLANEEIYPELIQDGATPENIEREALDLVTNESRRTKVQAKLAEVMKSLGAPGASARAAQAIVALLGR